MKRPKKTPKRVKAICEALERGLSIRAACRAGKIDRSTYFRWRMEDKEFATVTDDAIEEGTDYLEDVAFERAEDKSDLLTIFLLKGRRPEKFRDNAKVEVTTDRLEELFEALKK